MSEDGSGTSRILNKPEEDLLQQVMAITLEEE
jgi:hypothetical protein